MFVDIRNFSHFASLASPEEIYNYQQLIFPQLIDLVYQHSGFVHQILGDGFLALFSETNESVSKINALSTATKLIDSFQDISKNANFTSQLGIGLHFGNILIHQINHPFYQKILISGWPIIIARRLEQLNKKFNSQVLTTEEVLNNSNNFKNKAKFLGKFPIKNSNHHEKIWQLA